MTKILDTAKYLEENTEKTKYMPVSGHQNEGQNHDT
jgi:hypothetical protein